MKLKQKIKSKLDVKLGKYSWYESITSIYVFRVFVFTLGGTLVNVVFAVFNAVTALKYSSLWYGVFAGYYVIIALMRICVLFSYKFAKRRCGTDEEKFACSKTKIYLANGAFLVILDIALGAMIAVMLKRDKPIATGEIMAISSATYTTYKIVIAIRNIVKARHTNDWFILTIRDIGIVDALASLITLQTTLVSTFGEMTGEMFTLAAITGFAVCVFTVVLGVYIIVRGSKALKSKCYQTLTDHKAETVLGDKNDR